MITKMVLGVIVVDGDNDLDGDDGDDGGDSDNGNL